MSILDGLAILVGLLALAQFFIKHMTKWTTASKIVTFLVLAIISVLLWQCKTCNVFNSIENGPEPSLVITTTPQNETWPISTTEAKPTDTLEVMNSSQPTPLVITDTSTQNKVSDCLLSDANVVDDFCVEVYPFEYWPDSFGNVYRQSVFFDDENNSGYIIFSPLGNFSRLKGTIAVFKAASNEKVRLIEIFADDTSIYNLVLNKTDEPVQFDLDISGARQIKIVADGDVIIGDGVFYN